MSELPQDATVNVESQTTVDKHATPSAGVPRLGSPWESEWSSYAEKDD